MTPLIIVVVMMVFLYFSSRTARKSQERQRQTREQAIVLGNNVVTSSGFFGRVVDIDGDAVTLESPAGDETVWLRSAIMSQMDIPLDLADETDLDTTDLADDTDAKFDQYSDDKNSDDPVDPGDNQGSAWK